ncbi:MAG: ComEC/Rec2 family competence protein, partial [Eubacteriales bacterium]|nr:ComEC/Rec2 family competence protein [Eubacteriales bacterium]
NMRRGIRQMMLLLALAGFGFLTGWQASVTRAIVMSAVMLGARLFHHRADPINSIGIVVLIFMMVSPLSLLSFGFWLSVLATLGLIGIAPLMTEKVLRRKPHWSKGVVEWVSVSFAVQLVVLPLTIVLSHQINWIAMVANWPAVWLVEWITGMAILVLIGLNSWRILGVVIPLAQTWQGQAVFQQVSSFLGYPLAQALDFLEKIARFFAQIRWGRVYVANIQALILVAIVMSIMSRAHLMARHRTLIQKAALLIVVVNVIGAMISTRFYPKDTVWFLSVGQGDATLIQTHRGQTILIDTGKPNSGWKVILPALDELGIWQIDQLILSHGHLDHAGGAEELLISGRVGELFVSQAEYSTESPKSIDNRALTKTVSTTGGADNLSEKLQIIAENQHIEVQSLANNDTIQLSSKHISSGQNQLDRTSDLLRIIAPEKTQQINDLNELALHFQLTVSGQSIILMSDCSTEIETTLLANQQIGQAKILKVAHHGSKHTTLPDFLDHVQPQVAVISVGSNQYGHPAPEVLSRLSARAIETLRTDQQGAVELIITPQNMHILPFRKDAHG